MPCNCECADCVFNPNYCTNTPKPCHGADCDICHNEDMSCYFCSGHMTISQVNEQIKKFGKGVDK